MAHSKQTCSVFNCSSIRKKNPDLSFHLFPKEGEKIRVLDDFGIAEVCDRRKLWGMKLKIEKKINNSMAVCSRHFTQDDYECSGKEILFPGKIVVMPFIFNSRLEQPKPFETNCSTIQKFTIKYFGYYNSIN